MILTVRKSGGAPQETIYVPQLQECYLLRGNMDKDHGTDQSKVSIRSNPTIQLSPKWRRLIGMMSIRKITVLRYLFNCWYRRVLNWLEQDLFLTLVEDFSKSDPSCWFLLQQIRNHKIGRNSYLQWCELGWKGSFRIPDPFEIEDLRFQLETFARKLIFDQRALKGLISNKYFLRRLGFLLITIRSESVGKKIKRRRKRGHTDHGSLPSNPLAREADRIGGQIEFLDRVHNRLIVWLRNLAPP